MLLVASIKATFLHLSLDKIHSRSHKLTPHRVSYVITENQEPNPRSSALRCRVLWNWKPTQMLPFGPSGVSATWGNAPQSVTQKQNPHFCCQNTAKKKKTAFLPFLQPVSPEAPPQPLRGGGGGGRAKACKNPLEPSGRLQNESPQHHHAGRMLSCRSSCQSGDPK